MTRFVESSFSVYMSSDAWRVGRCPGCKSAQVLKKPSSRSSTKNICKDCGAIWITKKQPTDE